MTTRIREAKLDDAPVLYDISCRAHQSKLYEQLIPQDRLARFKRFYTENPKRRKSFETRMRYLISHPNHWVYVATDQSDKVIGYGLLSRRTGGYDMKGLFIDPNHQGQGAGSMIIRKKMTVAAPGDKLHLLVISGNEPAIGLYKKLGFKKVRVSRKRFFGATQDHMTKLVD